MLHMTVIKNPQNPHKICDHVDIIKLLVCEPPPN